MPTLEIYLFIKLNNNVRNILPPTLKALNFVNANLVIDPKQQNIDATFRLY